jgi:hypothetical protein
MTNPETFLEWKWQLDELLCNCAAASGRDSAELLREAFALLSAPPSSIQPLIGRLPDSRHFEALLALGAFESAALALLGDAVGYMLSSSANGASLASIILPGMTQDISAEGANGALALLTAFAAALLQGETKPLSHEHVPANPSLRLN